MKCEALTPELLARRSVPPSTMSLLGLVRHLAEVDRDRRNRLSTDAPLPKLYGARDADLEGATADETVRDEARAALIHEQELTDAAPALHADLGERAGRDGIALRELMVHRIEEYARHGGHADSLQECIDVGVGQ